MSHRHRSLETRWSNYGFSDWSISGPTILMWWVFIQSRVTVSYWRASSTSSVSGNRLQGVFIAEKNVYIWSSRQSSFVTIAFHNEVFFLIGLQYLFGSKKWVKESYRNQIKIWMSPIIAYVCNKNFGTKKNIIPFTRSLNFDLNYVKGQKLMDYFLTRRIN